VIALENTVRTLVYNIQNSKSASDFTLTFSALVFEKKASGKLRKEKKNSAPSDRWLGGYTLSKATSWSP
jgi:hypothetical protein